MISKDSFDQIGLTPMKIGSTSSKGERLFEEQMKILSDKKRAST